MTKPGYTAFRVEFTDTVAEVNLSHVHRSYLAYLYERGGETRFDWRKLTEPQAKHLREMIDRGLCIREIPVIGADEAVRYHRLTEAGRKIAERIIADGTHH